VAIVDDMLPPPAEARDPLDDMPREVDLEVLGLDPHVHPLTDQAAMN
jgi:hypothetical protein